MEREMQSVVWYRAAQKCGTELKKELIHSRMISVNCYETDTERHVRRRRFDGQREPYRNAPHGCIQSEFTGEVKALIGKAAGRISI